MTRSDTAQAVGLLSLSDHLSSSVSWCMMVDEVITLFYYSLPVNVATIQVMKLNSHTIAIIAARVLFNFSSVFSDDKNFFF